MTQIELYQTSLPVSDSILGKLEGTRCATARTAGSTAVYCSYCWQYSSILSYCWQYSSILSYCWQYSSILPVLLLLLLLLTSCRYEILCPQHMLAPKDNLVTRCQSRKRGIIQSNSYGNLPKVHQVIYTLDTICVPNIMILAQAALQVFC